MGYFREAKFRFVRHVHETPTMLQDSTSVFLDLKMAYKAFQFQIMNTCLLGNTGVTRCKIHQSTECDISLNQF